MTIGQVGGHLACSTVDSRDEEDRTKLARERSGNEKTERRRKVDVSGAGWKNSASRAFTTLPGTI